MALCRSNLKQTHVAWALHMEDFDGSQVREWANWESGGNARGFWYNKLLGHGMTGGAENLENGAAGANYLETLEITSCPTKGYTAWGSWEFGDDVKLGHGMVSLITWRHQTTSAILLDK